MPVFDLARRLRVMWRTTNVIHALAIEIVSQVGGDVGRAVIAEQPWLVHDHGLIAARGLQSQFQRVGDILGFHRGAELPGDDVTAVIVKDGAEIEPAPANDLEISEVRLPELVQPGCLVPELIGRADHHMGRCSDKIRGAKNAID